MNKTYAYSHNTIDFDFKQTVERFFVEEIPLYDFSNSGNFLILKIKKTDMSTWKLITVLAKACEIEEKEIGYAGLKDKNATAIQYISIPKKFTKYLFKNLQTSKIEVLDKFYNKSHIKIGHLKGNKFKIDLYNVSANDAKFFNTTAKKMQVNGIPNYYGYQRFGEDGNSYLQGKEIAHSGKKLRGSKERLLVSAYQSFLFNEWLSSRVKISNIVNTLSIEDATKKLEYPVELLKVLKNQKSFFKLFIGDIVGNYPFGKQSGVKDMANSSNLFAKQQISPTGLLAGDNDQRAHSDARFLEESLADSKETEGLHGFGPKM